MINTRQYRFTIINEDTGESLVMGVNPSGWNTAEERIFRHEDYKGILFEDELSLKYPKLQADAGGYNFILQAYESKGVKSNLYLKREVLNPYTNGYELDSYRKFDFDVDTGWEILDEYIEIKTIESSDVNNLLNRDEIEYDLFSLISSDNVAVKAFENAYQDATYKKIDIYLDAESFGYFNGEFEQLQATHVTGNRQDNASLNYLGYITDNDIGDRLIITDSSDTAYWYENTTEEETSLTDIEIEMVLNTRIEVTSSTSNFTLGLVLEYLKYDEDNELQTTGFFQVVQGGDGSNIMYLMQKGVISTPLVEIVSKTCVLKSNKIDVPAGWRVDFRYRAQLNNLGSVGTVTANLNAFTNLNYVRSFKFSEKTTGRADNTIKGMMAHEVITRQIQLMTSKTDENVVYAPVIGKENSEFQNYATAGDLAYEHFTNGFQLRQIADKALNISFKDAFQTLSYIQPIGLSYDYSQGIFYIDKISQFYKAELFPFVLEEIKDLVISPAKDFYYNEIESGYPDFENEDFQGAKEVNCATSHQMSIETSNKLDMRCPIHASAISMELARRSNKDTVGSSTDTKYDSENFICRLNTSYETVQGGLDELSGFSGISSYYNLDKTPRQNLQRNLFSLYQSAYFKDSSEVTQFVSSNKDQDISYKDPVTSNQVREFEDIAVSGNALVKPEFYIFDARYNSIIYNEIKKDPNRVVPYINKSGESKYGHIWEISGSRYKGIATYKLIRANEERLSL